MKTNIALRIASWILGLLTAVVTLLVPVTVYMGMSAYSEWRELYSTNFMDMVGVYTFVAIITTLFLAVTYLLLQYAIIGIHLRPTSKGWNKFFKSLAVADIAVLLVAVVSQIVFFLAKVIQYQGIQESAWGGVIIGWSPYMWQLTRRSSMFLVVVLLVFVFSFYWEYRRNA